MLMRRLKRSRGIFGERRTTRRRCSPTGDWLRRWSHRRAKRAVNVRVDAEGVERYAQDVEATVYFCVLEALQNVQKYANASQVVVRLRRPGGGGLTFEVEDDGAGFDTAAVTGEVPGSPTWSMESSRLSAAAST